MNVQGALRNFRTAFTPKADRVAGGSTFFTAVSYKFESGKLRGND